MISACILLKLRLQMGGGYLASGELFFSWLSSDYTDKSYAASQKFGYRRGKTKFATIKWYNLCLQII